MSWVYYITTADADRVKIGFTSKHPRLRIRDLQTGSPFELCIIAAEPGTERDERALHARFCGLRLHGEWFEMAQELRDHICVVNRREAERLAAIGAEPERWTRIFMALERGCPAEELDAV